MFVIVGIPRRGAGGLQQNDGQMRDNLGPLGLGHPPDRNGLERNAELARRGRQRKPGRGDGSWPSCNATPACTGAKWSVASGDARTSAKTIIGGGDSVTATLGQMSQAQQALLSELTSQVKALTDSNHTTLDRIRNTLDARVHELQEGNDKKLGEIRVSKTGAKESTAT